MTQTNTRRANDIEAEVMATITKLWHEYCDTLAALRDIEAAEHPDITDALGRVWTWRNGDLYTHDRMAWTLDMVTRPTLGLPTQRALDNPNYQWCAICRGEATAS